MATLNRAKGPEFLELLGDVPYELTLLADVPGATVTEETAATYRENALIKARAGGPPARPALGDDSGIEVDALGGGPGLHPARWGGPGLDDAGRIALLLKRLHGVPAERRTARFRCVIALAASASWRAPSRDRSRGRRGAPAALATIRCSTTLPSAARSASYRPRLSIA